MLHFNTQVHSTFGGPYKERRFYRNLCYKDRRRKPPPGKGFRGKWFKSDTSHHISMLKGP